MAGSRTRTSTGAGTSTSRSSHRRGECIFGRGCQGVLTEPTPELGHGCCSYGAHFRTARTRAHRAHRQAGCSPAEWQYAGGRPQERRWWPRSGRTGAPAGRRRLHLPQPFRASRRCRLALHLHALNTDVHFIETKPKVVLAGADSGASTNDPDARASSCRPSRVGDAKAGADGGLDFAWWCTEAPEASGRQPVYRSLRADCGVMSDDVYEAGRRLSRRPPPHARQRVRHPGPNPVAFVSAPARSHAPARSRRGLEVQTRLTLVALGRHRDGTSRSRRSGTPRPRISTSKPVSGGEQHPSASSTLRRSGRRRPPRPRRDGGAPTRAGIRIPARDSISTSLTVGTRMRSVVMADGVLCRAGGVGSWPEVRCPCADPDAGLVAVCPASGAADSGYARPSCWNRSAGVLVSETRARPPGKPGCPCLMVLPP